MNLANGVTIARIAPTTTKIAGPPVHALVTNIRIPTSAVRLEHVIRDYATVRLNLPPEPGTTPIPSGHIRLYHQTDEKNLEKIRHNGIRLSHARGIEGPKGIYADTKGFYGKPNEHPSVEFHVSKNRWQPPFVLGDVLPSEIIAIHYPWHSLARYVEENPDSLDMVRRGEVKDIDEEHRKVTRYILLKYGALK